jgi:hypothetical protein
MAGNSDPLKAELPLFLIAMEYTILPNHLSNIPITYILCFEMFFMRGNEKFKATNSLEMSLWLKKELWEMNHFSCISCRFRMHISPL